MVKALEKILEYELPLDIKRNTDGGYVARCILWTDCYAQGETIDEAVLEVTAVAQSLIELYTEEDLDIPLKLQHRRSIGQLPFTVPVFVTA